ncbi:uncharacterized protein LOC119694328 [Plutella xylostella]|uniref:uncharacterized protein LOC119694328 n=1 Tax=Plutella xylostella TaxID=51655 RepID=UPI0020325615|nr:uncharacterized protein LOC119694328 [Plutella xylostella]
MTSFLKQAAIGVLCGLLFVSGFGMEKMVGEGKWSVLDVRACDNPSQYRDRVTVQRRKLNRTHDVFDGSFDLKELIDNDTAIRLECCKYVDGGCKPFQQINDRCFCCFAKEQGGDNFAEVLSAAGLDPPDCPLPVGAYDIHDFLMDYDSLPEEGFFGKFEAKIFAVKDFVDTACLSLTVEFNELDDE